MKYVSPNFAGLQFEGPCPFSGLAGRTGQGYMYSGDATYNNSPLGIAAGYFLATNPIPTVGAARDGWDATSSSEAIFGGAINGGYQQASGTQLSADGATESAQTSIGSYGINGTSSRIMVILGMRHKF